LEETICPDRDRLLRGRVLARRKFFWRPGDIRLVHPAEDREDAPRRGPDGAREGTAGTRPGGRAGPLRGRRRGLRQVRAPQVPVRRGAHLGHTHLRQSLVVYHSSTAAWRTRARCGIGSRRWKRGSAFALRFRPAPAGRSSPCPQRPTARSSAKGPYAWCGTAAGPSTSSSTGRKGPNRGRDLLDYRAEPERRQGSSLASQGLGRHLGDALVLSHELSLPRNIRAGEAAPVKSGDRRPERQTPVAP
jgi:hypothetical protein